MTIDDQTKFLVAELVTNALATLNKHRGRISRPWDTLKDSEKAAQVAIISDAIANDVYFLTTTDDESIDLEKVIIASLIPTVSYARLVFTTQPATKAHNVTMDAIVVKFEDEDGTVLSTITDSVTLSKATGTGALSGTLTKAAVAGVATFDDIKIDTAGAFTLKASASRAGSVVSNSVTIT